MNHSRLLACLGAVAMLSACAERQDANVEPVADEAMSAPVPAPMEFTANDGGIPLSTASESAATQYMNARELADKGEFIEANQAARQLTSEHPEFAGGWIMLSNTALSGPQFVTATRKATELSAKATKGEQLWADINMSFITNDTDYGLRLGKELVDTYPESSRAWFVYSGLLAGQNRHDEARASAEKAIKLAPNQASGYNNLGFMYMNNNPKDFDKALANFNRAIEIEPSEDNYWINVGDAHRAMGDLESARGNYSRAWDLDATNEVAAIKRGHVNSFLGNFDDARADYNMGIAVGEESNQSTLANFRAFVHLHAGNHAAAVAELKSELDRIDKLEMPADQRLGARIFILTNIADICFNYNMLSEAETAIDQLTTRLNESGENSADSDYARQQNATATYWRAKLAARQSDYASAAALAEEFAALLADDDNPRKMERYHEVLGLIALRQEEYERAIEHYRMANLSTSAGNGDIKNIFMLATALRATGQNEEADELMKQVADWNFNSVWFAMLRMEASSAI